MAYVKQVSHLATTKEVCVCVCEWEGGGRKQRDRFLKVKSGLHHATIPPMHTISVLTTTTIHHSRTSPRSVQAFPLANPTPHSPAGATPLHPSLSTPKADPQSPVILPFLFLAIHN